MATRYNIYEIQLQDLHKNITIVGSGGKAIVTTAGDSVKATLYDPDSFASLSNPISATNGKFRFATAESVTSVDLYGIAPGGQAFQRLSVTPGGVKEIFIEADRMHQVLVIPWAAADVTAATEEDTGIALPAYCLVEPWVAVEVRTIDATETIDLGTLSTDSGDADGFLVGASVATAGLVPGALVGTDTLGALLKEDTNASSVLVPKAYSLGTAARNVSYTTSAGSDTGKGFFRIPYMRSQAN